MENWRVQAEHIKTQFEAVLNTELTQANFTDWLEACSNCSKQARDLYLFFYKPTRLNTQDISAKEALSAYTKGYGELFDTYLNQCKERAMLFEPWPTEAPWKRLFQVFESTKTRSAEYLNLHRELSELVGQYHRLFGSVKIVIGNEPLSLYQSMELRKRNRNRQEQQILWETERTARIKIAPEMDLLALKLLKKREELAHAAGYSNYLELAYEGRDYTPLEALDVVYQAQKAFQFVGEDFQKLKIAYLGIDDFRPWDIETEMTENPLGTYSLNWLETALIRAFDHIDSEFGEIIKDMFRSGNGDIGYREGKYPGATANYSSISGKPTITANITNPAPSDLRVLLHECGHAVHFGLSAPQKLFWLQRPPREISEFIAHLFECLGLRAIQDLNVLSPKEVLDLKRFIFMTALQLLDLIARYERFQHWLYSQPAASLSIGAIDAAYMDLKGTDNANWAGWEHFQKKAWHHHLVLDRPLYSVEYSIAWVLTTLLLEGFSSNNYTAASQIKRVMTYGNISYKSILKELNITFPFSQQLISHAAGNLRSELGFAVK
jgi:oligoendopeptidase F